MNKPILLLQFRTDESLEHERKCILEKGKFEEDSIKVINVLDPNSTLPKPSDLDKYSAIITGASGQFNVNALEGKHAERVKKLRPLFDEIIKRDFPTLAICFGNQFVAKILGGEVTSDKQMAETGTLKVSLTKAGRKSDLFRGVPEEFYVVLGHKQSICVLPENAAHLAYSEKCKYQAFRIGNNFYGIQFHPELDREGLLWRLALYPSYLKGRTMDDIRNDYMPIPHATKIINNFRKISSKANSNIS